MAALYTHKIYHDGGSFLTTGYVYDLERKACVDALYDNGVALGLFDRALHDYIRNGFIKRYGFHDWYLVQLDEVITRKMQKRKEREPEIYDGVFDWYFLDSVKRGLTGNKQALYIKEGLIDNFGDFEGIDDYVTDSVKRKLGSFHGRCRRFRRKTFLHGWTHFVTVTFDDKRDTPDSFRSRLKKCFSNLHTRNGWKYMGVFETGKRNNRLHFHALVNIPDGGMIGTVRKVKRFSFEKRRMVECWENSHFKTEFGVNDFSPIDGIDISWKNVANKTVNYILKYMVKNEEKIFYSRAVPDCRYDDIDFQNDIAAPIRYKLSEFVTQYVLFDDVIDDGELPEKPLSNKWASLLLDVS
ncbi:hypothetical protein FACS1894211_12910 [Clostridia bacterium]|nr:hypothetical protein FACS1894211_12910 [Clostridia bacterium]